MTMKQYMPALRGNCWAHIPPFASIMKRRDNMGRDHISLSAKVVRSIPAMDYCQIFYDDDRQQIIIKLCRDPEDGSSSRPLRLCPSGQTKVIYCAGLLRQFGLDLPGMRARFEAHYDAARRAVVIDLTKPILRRKRWDKKERD